MSSRSFVIMAGPDKDTDEEEEVNRMIERAFNNNNNNNNNSNSNNNNSSSHVIIPQLRAEFLQNPAQVLVRNILPLENPAEILDWDEGEKINRLVEFEANRKRTEELLRNNKLKEFAESVNAAINISVTNAPSGPVRVFVRPQDIQQNNNTPAAAVRLATGAANPDDQTGPMFAMNPTIEDQRDYQYGKSVFNALHQVEVTGEFTLSPEIRLGVKKSISSLYEKDPQKFKDAQLHHFLDDNEANTLMVSLCIAHINLQRIYFPKMYHKDGEEARRTAQINEMSLMAARQLKRLDNGNYVATTEEEQNQYMEEKKSAGVFRQSVGHLNHATRFIKKSFRGRGRRH